MARLMTSRYALYFTPKTLSDLYVFGCTVLGRTPHDPARDVTSSKFHDQTRWEALTKQPAHYGFHATLKAPFELESEFSEEHLIDAVSGFAVDQSAVELSGLAPRRLSHFMALTLNDQSQQLTDFAMSCVEHFERFRSPLSAADRQRRLAQSLTTEQIALLGHFGYPYVGNEFRFHMTLSSPLTNDADDFERWVSKQYHELVRTEPTLDQIALYKQPDRKTAFTELMVFPLTDAAPQK